MGCGASRLDPNHEGVPPRLRPLLRQRFEEMRARRGHPNYAPAPKPENIDHSSASASPKSIRSHDRSSNHHRHHHNHHHHHYEGALDCPKSQQMEDHGDHHEVKCRPVMPKGNEGNMGRKSEEVNTECFQVEVEGEEGGGRILERDCSPSFRVYCSDSSFENIPTFSDTEEFEGFTESEENTRVQSISTNDESVSSNEPSIKSLNRKGKRGRRLKQMIARGGKHKFHHKSSENPGALQRTVV